MKIYLDSSFIVALLLRDHESHDVVEREFSFFKKNQAYLYLSILTIDEIWYVLYRSEGDKDKPFALFSEGFSDILTNFLGTYKVHIPRNTDNLSLINDSLRASIKYNLRPRDAFHYSYAKNLKAKLYTLDQDFLKTDLGVSIIENLWLKEKILGEDNPV